MDKPKEPKDTLADLRKKAKKKLSTQLKRLQELSAKDVHELVQELGTHQIELEMQNEELRRAQEELEASRSRYADLYDFAPVGYLAFGKDGLIREANLTTAKLLGAERRSLLQKPFTAFIARDSADAFRSHCAGVLERQTKQTLEIKLKRRNRTEFFALLESIAVEDPGGNVTIIRTAVSDITSRRMTETALKESELLYRSLFENMTEGFALYELLYDDFGKPADWRVLEVNTAYTLHTGISRDRIVGRRISELFPAAIPEYLPRFAEVVTSQRPIEFETFARVVNRHHRVMTFPAGPARFASTVTDITERKQAAEALQASEQKLRLFIKHAPAAIAMLDRNMNYLAASRRWYKDYHVESKDVTGKNHYEIFPGTPAYWKDVHRSCLAGAIERKDADPWTHPDGTTDWIRWEVRPWRTSTNEVGGLIIFSENITTLKKAELALQTMNEQLEQRVSLRTNELTAANRTVKAERQRFYDVLEMLPAYVVLLTPDHHVPFANRFFRERFGEARGRRCYEYLFNCTEPCAKCDSFVPLTTNAPHNWEWTGPDSRNYDIFDYPFIDSDGSKLILEMGIDITERKHAEAALREINETLEQRVAERTEALHESRADLARAQVVGQIGSWRLDVNRNVLTWSDENHRIFGLPQGTPISYETFLGTIHPGDREYVDRMWKAALAGEPYDIEHRIVVGEQVKWVREKASLEFGKDGALLGGFGITQDVTERRRIEEALRKSSDRYRSYIEVTGQLGWTTNAQGEIEEDFPSWRSFTGQSLEEVKGWGWSRALHPDDLERTSRVWRESVATKSPYETEYRVRRRDGVYRHFLARGIPLLNTEGAVQEWIGTCIDITERKKSEEALQTLNAELELRVSQRTRFYAVLAQVNEAIIRCHEHQALFDEVCRIIVETGEFRLAWVGTLDPATQVVRPVASAGASSYLEGIRIIADDVPEGQGPIGRAIVERRPVISMDFELSENLAPWRERAREHGLRSCSAFPIRQNNEVVGALTIYSGQPGSFADDEAALLRSLADNVSFAIETIALEGKKRMAEQELRRSAIEIHDLYNNAPCGYHSLDKDGTIVRINDTELRWLGYRREDVVGKKKISDFYTPEGVDIFNREFPQFIRQESVANLEMDVVRRDGTVFPVLLNGTAVRDKDGNFVMTRSTMVDITERKKAEAESLRLIAAIESAADAVVITDPEEGRIQYVNKAFEQITGFSRSEAVGKNLHILDSGKQDEAFFAGLREELLRNGLWHGRIVSRKKDGSFFFEDRTCSPVRNAAGAIIDYVHFIRDVTDRLQLEAVAESVSAMDNIGSVFAGVRHEIGNPINNAKMMMTVLQQKLDGLDKERVQYYVERTLSEISRVEHLLMTLKSFNLFEAPALADLQTGPLLDLFRDLVSENLRQRGVALSLQVLPGAERVRADSRAFQHVLLNLVTNAADALKDREDPRIEITLSRDADRLRIRISDNGVGMTAAQIANLFKPFHTTKQNGTGLGLVIVKKMLSVMNGAIAITSRPGEGTVAEVDLPIGGSGGGPSEHSADHP